MNEWGLPWVTFMKCQQKTSHRNSLIEFFCQLWQTWPAFVLGFPFMLNVAKCERLLCKVGKFCFSLTMCGNCYISGFNVAISVGHWQSPQKTEFFEAILSTIHKLSQPNFAFYLGIYFFDMMKSNSACWY